jgi:hypothetical protein
VNKSEENTVKDKDERDLEKLLRMTLIKNQINDTQKKFKFRMILAAVSIGSFIVVGFFFFSIFSTIRSIDINISAGLSIIAGAFCAFLVMGVTGIVREFTIKSGFIEISSKLEEKIQNVQTDVVKTKKDIEDKISNLNQTIQAIDTKVTTSLTFGVKQDTRIFQSDPEIAKRLERMEKTVKQTNDRLNIKKLSKERLEEILQTPSDEQPVTPIRMPPPPR